MLTEKQIATAKSLLVANATDWHAMQIAKAMNLDFQIGPPGFPQDQLADAGDALLLPNAEQLAKLVGPIDLTADNIPKQVAGALRHLAQHLNKLANAAEAIPPEPFCLTPRAYVVRDSSGNVLTAKFGLDDTMKTHDYFGQITNETSTITCEPIDAFPDLQREYDRYTTVVNNAPEN